MKKSIILSILFIVAMIFTSCGSKQKEMENVLVPALKAPSTYKCISFEKYEDVTLEDEIKERLQIFTLSLDCDRHFVENDSLCLAEYTEMNKHYNCYSSSEIEKKQKEYEEHKAKYAKTLNMVNYLNSLSNGGYNLKEKTFTVYVLTYEAANSFGVPIRDRCYGRFSNDGKLVAIRGGEKESWVALGKYFSIPRYYDLI